MKTFKFDLKPELEDIKGEFEFALKLHPNTLLKDVTDD